MNNEVRTLKISRMGKLLICAILTFVGFGAVFLIFEILEDNYFYSWSMLCFIVIYVSMAIVVTDAVDTLEKGKRAPWVIGILCMPVSTIPFYIAAHGKKSAL